MIGLLLAASGGAVGAAGRYLIGIAALRLFGSGFPWATLTVNIVGSFLMGLIIVALTNRYENESIRVFFATGVLGGFTTFSAFSLDFIALMEKKEHFLAGLYLFSSVGISILALFLGLSIARSFIH